MLAAVIGIGSNSVRALAARNNGGVFERVCRLREGGFSIENVRALPTYCWRRDDRIQTLCSKKHLGKAPEEMDGDTWLRLKESYAELRELIDESIPMISR